MSATIVSLSEFKDTAALFEMRQFMLGDKTGNWIVVDDGTPLGRYIEKHDAQFHVDSLNGPSDKLSKYSLEEAIEFANKTIKW